MTKWGDLEDQMKIADYVNMQSEVLTWFQERTKKEVEKDKKEEETEISIWIDHEQQRKYGRFAQPTGFPVSRAEILEFTLRVAEGGEIGESERVRVFVEKVDNMRNVTVVFMGQWAQIAASLRSRNSQTEQEARRSKGYCQMRRLFSNVPFLRMRDALSRFQKKEKLNPILQHYLATAKVPDQPVINCAVHETISGLPTLTAAQRSAVRHSLSHPLTLVHGPPGTGKTITCAAIVYNMVMQRRRQKVALNDKILVAAPSNIATDRIAEKLLECGVNALRVYSRTRETFDATAATLAKASLHKLAAKACTSKAEAIRIKQLESKKEVNDLTKPEAEELRLWTTRVVKPLVEGAEVICTTCLSSEDSRLVGLKFSAVIVDEAAQATECEVLVPITKGASKVILAGDQKQLGPCIKFRSEKDRGGQQIISQLEQSLFSRLADGGVRLNALNFQYRMHPAIAQWPSEYFYEGKINNGITAAHRREAGPQSLRWPIPDAPVCFLHCQGSEKRPEESSSTENPSQVEMVLQQLGILELRGIKRSRIGIISPYEAQTARIINAIKTADKDRREREKGKVSPLSLRNAGNLWGQNKENVHGPVEENIEEEEQVHVANVDAFQGNEKDYIIFSTVRSNARRELGFMGNPKRLNVALTRARYGLVIIGDAEFLAIASRNRCSHWLHLLEFCQRRGYLRTGNLTDSQRMSNIHLGPDTTFDMRKTRNDFHAKQSEKDRSQVASIQDVRKQVIRRSVAARRPAFPSKQTDNSLECDTRENTQIYNY